MSGTPSAVPLGGMDTRGTDRAALTDLVRRATGDGALEVVDVECRTLHGGGGASTSGVYRWAGRGRSGSRSLPWSLVLKVIAPSPSAEPPSSWCFWEREAMAYRSGLLARLPGRLHAPRCLRMEPDPAGGVRLWLEDVAEKRGPAWPLSRYAEAASVLGAFNGSYLAARPLPARSWLAPGWLRDYVRAASPAFEQLRGALSHPLVRRLYPGDSAERLLDFWAERETLLEALDAQPQLLCHQDANRRNLLDTGSANRPQMVAVDWAFMGPGAAGQELAALVVGSVLLYEAEVEALPQLERVAFEAYLRGLRRTGWRGDERAVWLGYAATAGLRYAAYGALRLGILLDERQHAWAERVLGHPLIEFIDRLAVVRDFALARARAAGRGEGPPWRSRSRR